MSLRRRAAVDWLARGVIVYLTWLGMLACHELGHVLAAYATGGRVVEVELPLLGFSRTDVAPNPRPLAVAAAGPVLGAALPTAGAWAVHRAMAGRRGAGRARQVARFAAGFCLIANGAYAAIGWFARAGDGADLRRLGLPVWAAVAFGLTCVGAGLFHWHHTRGVAGWARSGGG